MGITWFWRSGARRRVDVRHDLTAAVADGRLGDLALSLVRLAAARIQPDDALAALSAMPPRAWPRLDGVLRHWPHWLASDDERRHITDAAASDPLALLITVCSRDGRLRQQASMAPLMRQDDRLLPLLLIRTADWVEQVRSEARSALPEALDSADTDALMRAARVAIVMRDWHRGHHAVATVTDVLRTRSTALDIARASDDIELRRLAYRLWLPSADVGTVLQAALSEPDNICHHECAEAAARTAVQGARPDLLQQLLASRFAEVRVEAVTGLTRLGHGQAAEAHLADRSAMVRATAQWSMRRAGLDPAERYRALLTSGGDARIRGIVAGLGECGRSTTWSCSPPSCSITVRGCGPRRCEPSTALAARSARSQAC